MLFVRMNKAWFTTIARRRKLHGGSSVVRRCTLERIKGINQIHCCALSDERHGAEWMQTRFFTLSCRWCFSMHFYAEPISLWVQWYHAQGALLSAALGFIQWHSDWKEFLLFSLRSHIIGCLIEYCFICNLLSAIISLKIKHREYEDQF